MLAKMKLCEFLDKINNLNDYIAATNITSNCSDLKTNINIATVLALKKIRSFEIAYFNKRDENGVACMVFKSLLASPPSKVWKVLAKELIYLLQYWLEAVRKHLVHHSMNWWLFLKSILKFIKVIRLKDPSIPNILVELTSECLFDLATTSRPDVYQRTEILHCLNIICAVSHRDIRFVMRTKFREYFVKIAFYMATSGYFPCQFSALECLIRWLVPRDEKTLRASAAEKWLPLDLCPLAAKDLFLNSNWENVYQDSRNFLNVLNEWNGLVTSVICRQLSIGDIVVINGSERKQFWLDFNTNDRSMSVLLTPSKLQVFGVTGHSSCEFLIIDDNITENAVLKREPLGLTISLKTSRAPYIKPIGIKSGNAQEFSIIVSSKTDAKILNEAMIKTFGDKYQLLLDLETDVTQSPQLSYNIKDELTCEDDTRFSHPVESKRKCHSGYIVRTKAGVLNSPSNASTSSLLHLKDKLAALPKYTFDKIPVSVCAQPELSNVSELTEDCRSVSTTKYQPYGVCQRTYKIKNDQSTEKQCKSEGETVKSKSRGGRRILSPVASDDNSTSLLLVATIGSANETVINETIERLSKSKDFHDGNIVDLLIQEALDAKTTREVSDSGINTDKRKSQQSETIDDTPNETKELRRRVPFKNCTVVSKSTTEDESNTETINETPCYVNTRKYKPKSTLETSNKSFPVKTIEEFFSQHIAENKNREVVISPTLAKKINETSSESSDNFDDNILFMNEEVKTDIEENIFNEIAVVDCLNDMVDKVCNDVYKLAERIYKDSDQDEAIDCFKEKKYQASKPKLDNKTPKRNVKTRKPVKRAKARVTKKTKNLEQENIKKMSTIIEQKEDVIEEIKQDNEIDVVNFISPEKKVETCVDTETPFVRRKRKLYSPKDIDDEIQEFTEQTFDDVPLSKIKKHNSTTATCYKELEQERKKYNIRLPRSKKSKTKVVDMPSPRTIKMDSMFDNLKQLASGNEEIALVDKNTNFNVYNFSSDSDDDFRSKKIKKTVSATTVGSSSTVKKGRKRRAKESNSSCDENYTKKTTKRKRVAKRTNNKTSGTNVSAVNIVGDKIDLVDEKMREAARQELNTSIVIENPGNFEPIELEPALKVVPQMEEIHEVVHKISKNTKDTLDSLHCSTSNDTVTSKKRVYKINKNIDPKERNETVTSNTKITKKSNKNIELLKIKKEKGEPKKDETLLVSDKEGTVSPLPGLVVESMPKHKDDINDSLTTHMLQKFKKLYRDGHDINDSTNTQRLLSDVDRFNSTQNCFEDDIHYVDNKNNLPRNKNKKKDPVRATLKKIKTEVRDDGIETIDILNDHSNQSEKSIATDGITAHGDFDEAPPSPENITKELQPREIQDMDKSMKDYFNKLTKEIHKKDRESSKSVEGEEVSSILRKEIRKSSVISPCVSIKRLSFEDISRWIPSRRTSDTNSSKNTPRNDIEETANNALSAKSSNSADITPNTVKTKPAKNIPQSIKTNSPIPRITRITSADIDKWLPMPKSFESKTVNVSQNTKGKCGNDSQNTKGKCGNVSQTTKEKFGNVSQNTKEKSGNVSQNTKEKSGDIKLVYVTRSKTKLSELENVSLTKENTKRGNKNVAKHNKPIEVDTDSEIVPLSSKADTRSLTTPRKARTHYADNTIFDKVENTKDTKNSRNREEYTVINEKEKSLIATNTKNIKLAKTQEAKATRESIQKINKSTISPIKFTREVSQIEAKSSDDELLKTIRSRFSRAKETKSNVASKSMESIIENSPIKIKSTFPVTESKKANINEIHAFKETEKVYEAKHFSENKKIEVLEDFVVTPSEISVHDWFRRSEQSDHSLSLKETIQNIMEKLDTTLVETNENTSKKLVNLFVGAQKNLSDLKDEQRKLCKQAATELIREMVAIIDKTFIDLDKKSQEKANDFMDKLKNQAFDLIGDDCKQKRAMFVMLKEDVQAVLDHIAYSKRTDSP